MSTKQPDPFGPFLGPGAEAFKLWISFFPTAPLFGVNWVFGDMMPGAQGTARKAGKTASTGTTSTGTAKGAPAKARKASEAAPAKPEAPASPAPAKPEPPASAAPAKPETAPAAAPRETASPATAPAETSPAAEAPATSGEIAPARPAGLFDAAPAEPDDLKLIRGIGPGLESKLNALGIYKFDQIAQFSEPDLVWIDENLTAFKGRCFRDDWVGQARELQG